MASMDPIEPEELLDRGLEAVVEAFETGWRKRAACCVLANERIELLQPVLAAVEESWTACRQAERHYHRHAFRESLASIGLWAFIVLVGFAPLSVTMAYLLVTAEPGIRAVAVAAVGAMVAGAWMSAPRVPPWNVLDRRARALALAAECLLESLQESDASRIDEMQHRAMLKVLAGCTNDRSTTYNLMLSVALLRAVRKVGDGRHLPLAERLARGERGPLRDAAEACLPALRARRTREWKLRSLLRPYDSLEAADDLLRPAGRLLCPAEQLVRPMEHVENRAA